MITDAVYESAYQASTLQWRVALIDRSWPVYALTTSIFPLYHGIKMRILVLSGSSDFLSLSFFLEYRCLITLLC